MSFSWSAPQFTPDDEARERASMSADEARQVRDDVHGHHPEDASSSSFSSSFTSCASSSVVAPIAPESTHLCALTTFDDALNRIPVHHKEAYLRARSAAPQIVQSESDPRWFLRTDDGDAKAAALRLVRYWDWRYKIFGDHLACLPMTLQGALREPQDQVTLQASLVQPMPNDKHGRAVLYMNRWKVSPTQATRESYMRVVFFVCHCVAQEQVVAQPFSRRNSFNRHRGVVVVLNMRSRDMSQPVDRRLGKYMAELFTSGLPLKLQAMHCCLQATGRNIYGLALPAYKQLLSRHIRLRTVMHSCCDANLLARLDKYGIAADGVPIELGGTFGENNFVSWLRSTNDASYDRDRLWIAPDCHCT